MKYIRTKDGIYEVVKEDGVWVRHSYNSIDYEPFRIDYWKDYKTNEKGMLICGMEIKDYGKTWALMEEELQWSSQSHYQL